MRSRRRERGKLKRLVRLAALGAVVVAAVRAVIGRKKPEITGEASWPPLSAEAPPESSPAGGVEPLHGEPTATASATSAPATSTPDTATEQGWVEPVDGSCPASHPIKGNAQSMIFHVPGGASYDRTVPERCYASAEAAEADGFRAARR